MGWNSTFGVGCWWLLPEEQESRSWIVSCGFQVLKSIPGALGLASAVTAECWERAKPTEQIETGRPLSPASARGEVEGEHTDKGFPKPFDLRCSLMEGIAVQISF